MIPRSNEHVEKTTTLKKCKLHKITDYYPPQTYNCTKEKQILQQLTGRENYCHKKRKFTTITDNSQSLTTTLKKNKLYNNRYVSSIE